MEDDDTVFRALADRTRRRLLDRLFERDGRTLGELEQDHEMTRFGVMKHLKVLEDAGLVVTRRSGREKLHFLNPVPIRLVHDRWIDKFTERHASALAELKHRLERPTMTASSTATHVTTQVYQVLIKASPQQIWDAITQPEFTRRYFHGASVETTGEAGTPLRYYAPDGETLWGDETILESEPPYRLVVPWRSLYSEELAAEPASRVTWLIEEQADGVCLLTATHDRLEESPKTAQSVGGIGWLTVVNGLKTLLETGQPLFPPAVPA